VYAWAVVSLHADTLIRLALEEDLRTGDLTSEATIELASRSEAIALAKAPTVVSGLAAFARTFELVDPSVVVNPEVAEGSRVDAGTVLARVLGPTRSLLAAERTALNILQRTCGTATLTRRFVDKVAGTGARILDTRKTTPGMRGLQKEAVRAGGGHNHRCGLDSGVLIKDNHLAACGSIQEAVARARLRAPHGLKIEVEVSSLEALDLALAAGADVVLLDNLDLGETSRAVARVRACGREVLVEASGNMTLDRVRAVAETGVDLISVGALTHSAPAADISLEFVV
jgi:nicotinate-nucleotide pyrophosphorylase (carboxylating)